ncbi:MAG: hypothetical protein AAFQ73_04110 [Pseudomonadota bacterium]
MTKQRLITPEEITRRQLTLGLGATALSSTLPLQSLAGDRGTSGDQSGGGVSETILLAQAFVLLLSLLTFRPRGLILLGDDGAAGTTLPDTADLEIQDRVNLSNIPLLGRLQSPGITPAVLTAVTLLAPIYVYQQILIADLRRNWVQTQDVIALALGVPATLQGIGFMNAAMGQPARAPVLNWLTTYMALALVFLTFHQRHRLVTFRPVFQFVALAAVLSTSQTLIPAHYYFAGVIDAARQGLLEARQVGELHRLENQLIVSTAIE